MSSTTLNNYQLIMTDDMTWVLTSFGRFKNCQISAPKKFNPAKLRLCFRFQNGSSAGGVIYPRTLVVRVIW